MKSTNHLLVSLFLASISLIQGNIQASILCMTVGWLIDADHEIDHFIYTGRFINPVKLGESLSKNEKGKLYILLHGWEYLYLLIVVSSTFNLSFLIATSYACHLIMDLIGNDIQIFLPYLCL